jgi:hypothetical protein
VPAALEARDKVYRHPPLAVHLLAQERVAEQVLDAEVERNLIAQHL